MSSEDEEKKIPSLPESYKVPKVWTFNEQDGAMGSINRPTAGARSELKLPKGEHDLQLYSLGTPNGQKVTILLEELYDLKGIEYDAWLIKIFAGEQFGSDFVDINPNSKIPALLDTSMDPPVRVFETGSILLYLGEKYQAFIPSDPRLKTEMMNWLMWQVGTAPYLGGGFGHFYTYAPIKIEYAIDRFAMEVKRQLDVLDQHLAKNTYMVGDEITLADFAIWPWIVCIDEGYKAKEFLQTDSYKHLQRWIQLIGDRPAVQRGARVNRTWGDDGIAERHSAADFGTDSKL